MDTIEIPEGVSVTFDGPCLDCGATVHVENTVRQPHDCHPVADTRELVAKAYWAGYELGALSER